jgi:hypothetical protein
MYIRHLIHKKNYGTSESSRLHVRHSRYTTACTINKTIDRLVMNQQAEMNKRIQVGFIN